MTTKTVSPLQKLTNSAALKAATAQYRLARLFTPYGFEPERVDYDRVEAFLDNPAVAFPAPTESVQRVLDRIQNELSEGRAMLQAFAAQDIHPTLDADQLFVTAQANVVSPHMARTA